MSRNIDDAAQRTRRYWYEDGLWEIASGLIILVLGASFFVKQLLPPGPMSRNFAALAMPVIVIGGLLLARRLVSMVRSRITYPRTGYVAYRPPSTVRSMASASIGAAVAAIIAALAVIPAARAWTALVDGIVFAIAFLYIARYVGLVRFYALGVVSILAGAGAFLTGLDYDDGFAFFFSVVGISLIASGSIALRSYLGRTPPIAQE